MAAVGSGTGPQTVRFTALQDTVNHVAAEGDSDGVTDVPLTTLDLTLARASSGVPILIKVDVEGYETEVMAGAEKTLAAPELLAVIMELNGSGARYGFDEKALHQRMLGYGFRPFTYDGLTRTLAPLDRKNEAQGNTLYLRGIEIVEKRIANSRRFNVQGTLI